LFAQQCSSCHSLVGDESQHKQGGDLLGYSFTRAALLEFAGEMPTPRTLDAAELKTVVDYVLRAQRPSR
jgi:mono/diheme cytochrome c family protein